ncbi:MAG: 16S rRNA (guanine(527)-N(7))-methyltransferase RsmG [SAR86 cluster bacterium]|uniref:Ribosomal RNA small subunit methyltransferase G n=1 Tax=SAR86 cluster bacterium TaxID=2030880 RepID=A0A2A4MQZ0_9GAMM|nr:MAG: 16S rRNA (guanine(527)-N(7))-methyltransferase RsmG [SAR86 cluster bacterium]
MEKLKQELAEGISELGLTVTDQMLGQLLSYLQLLLKWNKTYNLTAVKDIQEMVSRHLLDSLAVSPYLEGHTIIDVGSGAGLPGIPLGIIHPDKEFTLIDSNGKKTRFLFQAKLELGLGNITIANERIENFKTEQQVDIVMCRAFSSLSDVLAKSQQIFSQKTKLLALKGNYPQEEIENLSAAYQLVSVIKIDLPGANTQRHLVEVIRKQ